MPKKIKKKAPGSQQPKTPFSETGPPLAPTDGPSVPPVGSLIEQSLTRLNSGYKELHDRRVLSPIPQSPSKLSTPLDKNMYQEPNQRTPPDSELTPRPLRILKTRGDDLKKKYEQVSSLTAAPTGIPYPTGRTVLGSLSNESLATALRSRSVKNESIAPTPYKSFLGLFSPTKKPLCPDSETGDCQQPPKGPDAPKETRASFEHVPDLSYSSQVPGVLDHIIPKKSGLPGWKNWRGRSNSEPVGLRLPNVGRATPINNLITASVLQFTDEPRPKITSPAPSSTPISAKHLRRATSAGPGYFQGGGHSLSATNLAQPKSPLLSAGSDTSNPNFGDVNGKAGMFSRMMSAVDLAFGNERTSSNIQSTDVSIRSSLTLNEESGAPKGSTCNTSIELTREGSRRKDGTLPRNTFGSIRRKLQVGADKPIVVKKKEPSRSLFHNPESIKKSHLPLFQPPILTVQINAIPEVERMHVSGRKELWVCVGVEANVVYPSDWKQEMCSPRGEFGLDVAIVMDLSSYASPATFEDTKSAAKSLIEELSETDNASLIAFTSLQNSSGVGATQKLGRLTAGKKEELLEFIDGIFHDVDQHEQLKVQEHLATVIRSAYEELSKVSNMPEDLYGSLPRKSHLVLLTPKFRAADLPDIMTKPSEGQVQFHLLGMGPLGSLKYPDKVKGWNLVLSPWAFQGVGKNRESQFGLYRCKAEAIPRVVKLLRFGIDFGVVTNIRLGLTAAENCKVLGIIGDAFIDALVPGEQRTVLVKLLVGEYNPCDAPDTTPTTPNKNTPSKTSLDLKQASEPVLQRTGYSKEASESNEENKAKLSEMKVLERELAATLGDVESQILHIAVKYEHSYFGDLTTLTTRETLILKRFNGDGKWGLVGERSSKVGVDAGPNWDQSHEMPKEDSEGDENLEHVRMMLAKKIAESNLYVGVHESPRKALRAVEEWGLGAGIRGRGVHAVARELEWRVRVREEDRKEYQGQRGDNDYRVPREDLLKCPPTRQIRESPHTGIGGFTLLRPSSGGASSNYSWGGNSKSPRSAHRHDSSEDNLIKLRTSSILIDSQYHGVQAPDEAGRLWRQLAESKLGLLGHSRVADDGNSPYKDREKERRRRRVRRARRRISSAEIKSKCFPVPGDVKDEGQVSEEKRKISGDYEAGKGIGYLFGNEVDLEGRIAAAFRSGFDLTTDNGGYEGDDEEKEYEGVNSRDTMKSLVTLRNVKETDFSPWA